MAFITIVFGKMNDYEKKCADVNSFTYLTYLCSIFNKDIEKVFDYIMVFKVEVFE